VAYQVWCLASKVPCCSVSWEPLLSHDLCFIIHKQFLISSKCQPSASFQVSTTLYLPPNTQTFCWIPAPYELNRVTWWFLWIGILLLQSYQEWWHGVLSLAMEHHSSPVNSRTLSFR
jgi:hypothetical protein